MFYDFHACRVTKFQNFQRFAATICYQKTIDKGILSQKNAGGTSITEFFRGWLQYVSNITVAKKKTGKQFLSFFLQQFRLGTMHKLQENPFYRYKEPIKPLNIIRSHCSQSYRETENWGHYYFFSLYSGAIEEKKSNCEQKC